MKMYANDLICIFMNINENIKKMHKNQRKNIKILLIINHYTDPEDTETPRTILLEDRQRKFNQKRFIKL